MSTCTLLELPQTSLPPDQALFPFLGRCLSELLTSWMLITNQFPLLQGNSPLLSTSSVGAATTAVLQDTEQPNVCEQLEDKEDKDSGLGISGYYSVIRSSMTSPVS